MIGHGSILQGILRNILTLKLKPPKLILRQLYENFCFENNLLYGILCVVTISELH